MTPRLKSEFWVSALVKRAQSLGGFSTVLRKGDRDAGIALIILRNKHNQTLYTPERNFEGERQWREVSVGDQAELDTLVNRRIDNDPDIWLIEIESDQPAETLIGEPVIKGLSEPDPTQAAAEALFRGK